MGMLQLIQAGAVRYGGCPVRSEVAHAEGRGDGNPAVRVRNVDPRQGALRGAANGTPQVSPTEGFQRRQRTDHIMPYAKALKKIQCESCGVGWYVWRPGGGVDGEEQVGVIADDW